MQLIKECVYVINKPCVQESRYMRLISWTLQSGSEQLPGPLIREKDSKRFSVMKIFTAVFIVPDSSQDKYGY
jgi:hypothetical protein